MEENNVQGIGNSTNSCIFDKELETTIKMKKLPKINEEELLNNPFRQELVIPVTEIVRDIEYTKTEDGVIINKVLYAEKTQKVELYIHPDSGNNVAGLSDKAQRLFLHILYTMKSKQDWIYMNTEHYMKRNEIKSMTTVSNAITELCRYQFILKSHIKGVYWINPHRFFPGSRLRKYESNKKVVQKWDQTQ